MSSFKGLSTLWALQVAILHLVLHTSVRFPLGVINQFRTFLVHSVSNVGMWDAKDLSSGCIRLVSDGCRTATTPISAVRSFKEFNQLGSQCGEFDSVATSTPHSSSTPVSVS